MALRIFVRWENKIILHPSHMIYIYTDVWTYPMWWVLTWTIVFQTNKTRFSTLAKCMFVYLAWKLRWFNHSKLWTRGMKHLLFLRTSLQPWMVKATRGNQEPRRCRDGGGIFLWWKKSCKPAQVGSLPQMIPRIRRISESWTVLLFFCFRIISISWNTKVLKYSEFRLKPNV